MQKAPLVVCGLVAMGLLTPLSIVGCSANSSNEDKSEQGGNGEGGEGGDEAGGAGGEGGDAAGGEGGGGGVAKGGTAGSSAGGAGGTAKGGTAGTSAGGSGGTANGGTAGSSAGGTAGTAAGGTAGMAAGGAAGMVAGTATEANLKIAFAGDTTHGSNYAAVLDLVKAENAQALVVPGDMTYNANPGDWWNTTEGKLGASYPVFLARGNHDDSSWSGFLPKAQNHLGGAQRIAGPHDAAYKTVFKGLSIASIRKDDNGTVVQNLFKDDKHLWKICLWHHNQTRMQVGGKGDEAGWTPYEACRTLGAVIMTAHEHSYQRTKTMTNVQNQTIDSTCSTGNKLCVGPGRTFVTVTGLGGNSVRTQQRCHPTAPTAPFASLNTTDPSCPIWASIYTSNQGGTYGAQFITFNVDGNPKKAKGYFKTISGAIIDQFEIQLD